MPATDVKFALIRSAAPTSTGNDDVTVAGLGTTHGAFVFGHGTTIANDTQTDQGSFFKGLATGSAFQAAVSCGSANGVTENQTSHRGRTTSFIARQSPGNTNYTHAASYVDEISDGIRVNVTAGGSTAFLRHFLLLAGGDASAEFAVATENQSDGAFTDLAITFVPSCGIIITSNDDLGDQSAHTGYSSDTIGFFSRDSTGVVRLVGKSTAWRYGAATECYSQISGASLPIIDPSESTAGIDGEFSISFPNTTTLRLHTISRTNDAQAAQFAILLIDTGDLPCHAGVASIAAATGLQLIGDCPFVPQMQLLSVGQMLAADSFSGDSASAGTFGLGCVTRPPGLSAGNGEFCVTCSNEQGESTTDVQGYAADQLIYIPADDGASAVAGDFDSFAYGGSMTNITTAPGATIFLPYLAVAADVALAGRRLHRDTIIGGGQIG